MNNIVITTINPLNDNIKQFTKVPNFKTIIVGDDKSTIYHYKDLIFLSLDDQLDLKYRSISTTPENHYSRKNIGYLYAMVNGAEVIYESDDDTFINNDNFLKDFKFECNNKINSSSSIINIYKLFTKENIWHRGFDITKINENIDYKEERYSSSIGVWQGLINRDTDVDAIYRLTNKKVDIKFDEGKEISLNMGLYSPFNTQNTLWRKECFPLMYLPMSVNFRFTDILRGYVAQRIMWEYGYNLGFHSPDTYQIRNKHDYLKDFKDEMSMYLIVPRLIDILNNVKLSGISMTTDLCLVYHKLFDEDIVSKYELLSIKNWVMDLNYLLK